MEIIGGNGTWILNGGFFGSNLLLFGADVPVFPMEDSRLDKY